MVGRTEDGIGACVVGGAVDVGAGADECGPAEVLLTGDCPGTVVVGAPGDALVGSPLGAGVAGVVVGLVSVVDGDVVLGVVGEVVSVVVSVGVCRCTSVRGAQV